MLLHYQFYPPDVMRHTSDFSRDKRRMRSGDRIVQRIRVITLFGFPGIDVITMNRIVNVIDEPRCAGLTYATTTMHSEEGRWSASVTWDEADDVWLDITAVSRPSPREPRLIHPLMIHLQKRAHRRGMEAFLGELQPNG
jgi:uncharacterized protein (UPF0548 family)